MNRIFRISGAAILMVAGGFALAPVSTPALAGQLTCTPTTVSVAPAGGNLVVTCTDASTGGTPPPSTCSVSVAPSSLTSAGGTVTVTASNCGVISSWSGTSPTTAMSTANGQTPIPTSFPDNLPANSGTTTVSYTYKVVGDSGTNSATVSVSGTGTSSGGGASCGTTSCLSWADISHWQGGAPFNIPANGSFTVQFTVPAGLTGTTRLLTQFTGSNNRVNWTLASAPGVLPNPDPILKTIPFMSSQGYVWTIAIGGTSSSWLPALQPGGTYYINVQNPQNNAVSFYVKIG